MDLIVEQTEIWAASIEDKPGALAGKLSALADAGADLDFIIARRRPDKPGTGVVYVTPLRGDREVSAATTVGFAVASSVNALRIEGKNEPGVAAKLSQKLADAKLNMRGLSAAVVGSQFVIHVSFDKAADAQKAIKLLQKA